MIEQKVDFKAERYQPKMKVLDSWRAVPLYNTIILGKADGMFAMIFYNPKQCFTINKRGYLRFDFPALNETQKALKRQRLKQAILLAEIHAVEDGKPTNLPRFIRLFKGEDKDLTKIHIGVFDIVSINEKHVEDSYEWRIKELDGWFRGCKLVGVLPYVKVESREDVFRFWTEQVLEKGYEGIVVRTQSGVYKLKPKKDVDAVIIGINKRSSRGNMTQYRNQKVRSLKLALMDKDGSFVELGDVSSGINGELAEELYYLTNFKVAEDEQTVWIKPLIVCQVEYQETFEAEKRRLIFDGETYHAVGTVKFRSLRHPRLLGFRKDKKVCSRDLRLTQIPT